MMASEGSNASLFEKLKLAKRLPSPPGTALRILELCRDQDVEVQDIATVIMADPALSSRLLKFANSPMAGLHRTVASVREAVLLLGLRTVKLTALGFSLAPPALEPRCAGFDLRRYWVESFLRAVIARRLADTAPNADREESFTAALLAKIGQIALALSMPEQYGEILLACGTNEAELLEMEQLKLGMNHGQFGAMLLAQWELPDVLVETVEAQADDRELPDGDGALAQRARVIRLANKLVPVFTGDAGESEDLRAEARDVVESELELEESAWQQIAEEIQGEFNQFADVFDIKLDSQADVMAIYAEAQEQAARVGMVAQIEQVEAMKANADLLRRATTDALTGLANRAKFDERIDELVKGFLRGHGDFALFLMDIDHFKKFNDTYGHQTGDLVLKRVGVAIKNALRDVDTVARYGGEEFAVLAPQTDRKGACVVAARIQRCVEALRVDVDGQELGVTISQGLVLASDFKESPTVELVIRDADRQLYLSKANGRNTWSYLGRSASRHPSTPAITTAAAG